MSHWCDENRVKLQALCHLVPRQAAQRAACQSASRQPGEGAPWQTQEGVVARHNHHGSRRQQRASRQLCHHSTSARACDCAEEPGHSPTRNALEMMTARANKTRGRFNKHVDTSSNGGGNARRQGRSRCTPTSCCSPSTREPDIICIEGLQSRANTSHPVRHASYGQIGRRHRHGGGSSTLVDAKLNEAAVRQVLGWRSRHVHEREEK